MLSRFFLANAALAAATNSMRMGVFSVSLAVFVLSAASAQASWITREAPEPLRLSVHQDASRAGNPPTTACLPVTEIVVEGLIYVEAGKISAMLQRFAFHCQSQATLAGLLGVLNKAHADAGYITTQAYLPQQDIRATKKVRIEVVPGRIDAVRYSEERDRRGVFQAFRELRDGDSDTSTFGRVGNVFNALDNRLDRFSLLPPQVRARMAMPLKSGDVLHLEKLQQGLDQINRTRSSQAKSKLEAGAEPATSTVVINNRVADTFRLYVGFNEENPAGLTADGDEPGSNLNLKGLNARIEKDNLIGINDLWRVELVSEFNTNELTGHVSVPWRWTTFSIDGQYSESLSQLTERAELLNRSGSVTFGVSHLATRTKTNRTTLGTSLKLYASDRFINAVELTPQRFSVLRASFDQVHYFPNTVVSGGIGIAKGLRAFGATEDPSDPIDTAPRAQFLKVDGRLAVTRAWQKIGSLAVSANAQWTTNPLYSSEQLTFGSDSSVRGFQKQSFVGDRGFYGNSEFTPKLPIAWMFGLEKSDQPSWFARRLARIQPYAFMDVGYGMDIANDEEDLLLGAGGGVRYTDGRWSLSASYSQPLYRHHQDWDDDPHITFKTEFKVF